VGRRAILPAQYAEIAAAYRAGATTVALAVQYRVSEGTIRMAVIARGEKIRPRAERSRRMHAAAGRGTKRKPPGRGVWPRIPADEWAQLRATKSEDELVAHLEAVLKGCPIPYPKISDQKAAEAFDDLCMLPFDRLFGEGPIALLRSPDAPQAPYHLALKPPGNAASNQLFYVQRWATPRAEAPSVERRWHDPELRRKVYRRFLKLSGVHEVSPATMRQALCVTGGTPSQFKPGVARALYELTGAQDVLDFSAGWGDRLVGFCAAPGTRRYVGIDPNRALHPLYQEVAARYARGKSTEFICGPAEEALLPAASFDLAMTSPPYFGVERYAAGAEWARDQSWARYATAEAWRAGFLAQAIRRVWAALRPGGVLAVNLADVKVRGEQIPLCAWLRQEVTACESSVPLPVIGLRLQAGNYSTIDRTRLSGEPVWMWSKGALGRPFKSVHRNITEEVRPAL
jgi:hypothetical protein